MGSAQAQDAAITGGTVYTATNSIQSTAEKRLMTTGGISKQDPAQSFSNSLYESI